MATNQNRESSKAVKTPGAIPNQAIINETTSGKVIAPARGVIATNRRNILLIGCEIGLEPFVLFSFIGVRIVLWSLTFKLHCDISHLLSFKIFSFDQIFLTSVTKRDL